jgi:hypothetical protein
MSGAIPSLPQYTFMTWCSAKAQGSTLFGYKKAGLVFSVDVLQILSYIS